jgi:hypothetical protein
MRSQSSKSLRYYQLAAPIEVCKPLAAAVKALLIFVPKAVSPAVAAATTSAMIVTYSTKAAPSSFFAKFFVAFQSFTMLSSTGGA